MTHIHWYPGHIAKAEKELKNKLNLVDMVIEILDARIPLSSQYPDIKKLLNEKPRLILLNKSDMTDFSLTKKWQEKIKKETNFPVLITSTKVNNDIDLIINKITELSKPAIDKLVQKGLLPRPARVMIIGMPNVGKSSVINKLIRKTKAKTGAKAGVTRQQQWVRINPKVELLDTPGIIPLKQEDQKRAYRLAFVGSIGENAINNEMVATELLEEVSKNYLTEIKKYYGVDADLSLENIAISRNWLISGNNPDINRTAVAVLNDFREGRTGKITLDELTD